MLDSPLLHFAQHACFFAFGLAMWLPLVGPLPKPAWFGDGAKLVYIVVVRLLEAVLANVLIWSGTVLYPDYAPGEAEWEISPLADQGAAGNLMMIWTGAVTLALFTWLFLRAAEPQRREAGADRARRARGRRARPGARRLARSPPARASACASGSSGTAREPSNRFLYAARLRGRDLDPRRRDRRRAVDGAVLRRLDDRLGEHDRGRPRRALDRLLARRPARRSLPEPAQPLPGGAGAPRCCWRWSRSSRSRSSTSRSSALDEIEAGAFVGSLFAVLFLIAIPVGLAGTCSPWAIRLAVPDVEHSGRVAGRLYAISTVGSLLGTMLAALVLIPFVGTQRTFLVFALVIALVAAAGLGWRAVAAPVAVAAAMAIPVGTVKATDEGTVIFETDSEHQYIRVIEQPDGDRALELNEGQATHSLYRPGSFLTGDVWDGYLVLPFTALDRAAGADRDPRQRRRAPPPAPTATTSPRPRSTGSRSTPSSSEVGLEYFDMGSNREPDRPQRGRPAVAAALRGRLRRDHGRRLPPALHPVLSRDDASSSSSSATGSRPGGVVIVNAGHPEGNDDLEKVLSATMAEVFPTVLRDPIEPTNTLLIGTERAGLGREPDARGARASRPSCAPWREIEAARIGPRACPAAPSTPTTRRRSSG